MTYTIQQWNGSVWCDYLHCPSLAVAEMELGRMVSVSPVHPARIVIA